MFDIADTTNHSLYYTTGTLCQLAVVSNSCHLELSKNSSATMFEYVLLLSQALKDTPMNSEFSFVLIFSQLYTVKRLSLTCA